MLRRTLQLAALAAFLIVSSSPASGSPGRTAAGKSAKQKAQAGKHIKAKKPSKYAKAAVKKRKSTRPGIDIMPNAKRKSTRPGIDIVPNAKRKSTRPGIDIVPNAKRGKPAIKAGRGKTSPHSAKAKQKFTGKAKQNFRAKNNHKVRRRK
jgi:hypothetical protein